ncbi:MAG: ATP-binding protein [Bacteroidota bacterium]
MKKRNIHFYGILIVLAIIVVNQVLIQYWLYQRRKDAKIINVSGRQRMLSQKLIVNVLNYQQKSTEENLRKITKTYQTWSAAHLYLKGILQHSANSAHAFLELKKLDSYFDKAKVWETYPTSLSVSKLETFQKHQEAFLMKMDSIVGLLEADSNRKLKIILIEFCLGLFSLFIVYYKISVVFKKINDSLTRRNKSLAESNSMLEKFAYLAAHDLKAPSLNVLNFAKLLKRRLKNRVNASELEFLDIMIQSSKRLYETTNDLLKFSTINNGAIKVASFQPEKMLEDIMTDLDLEIKKRKAKIFVENFPESIHGDQRLLRLVFQNLISNGMKFVDQKVIPTVKIAYQDDKVKHVFTIEDNGIGIEESDKDKIFGMFKRLHNEKKYEGTGIGLSICRKVIEKHKGEILLESDPSKGSVFKVVLPKYLQN